MDLKMLGIDEVEFARVVSMRPDEETLKLAMMVTHPTSHIGAGVACVLKSEVEALQMLVELERLTKKNLLTMTGLLTGLDMEKTIAALKEWDTELPKLRATVARVEKCLDECAQTEGADEMYVYVYAVQAALKGEAPGVCQYCGKTDECRCRGELAG